jgi:hypothetical protein
MPAIHKGSPKIKFQFVASKRQSVLGGLPAIEAMAQEFDLWSKLRRLALIDPRKRKGSGFGPDAIVAQFIYCFAAGGTSLADAERLEEDSLVRRLARMDGFADETTLGQWLRAQTPESVRTFWKLIHEFIAWAAQRAEAGRWKYCSRAEVFFDDTQLEVSGRKFEGAKVNYNGDLALSWQTFWFGPWLVTKDEVPDPQDLHLWLEVDGERRQDGNTKTMVYGVAFLVSYLSQFMSLLPGDVISTGTPPGVGLGMKPPVFLRAGQTIRLGIDGLGVQTQRTVAEP